MTKLAPYLTLMRPKQWVKNLLILAPAFFAGSFFTLEGFLVSLLTIIAFSLTASAVYVLNDLLDAASDAQHPEKRRRPLPSGAIKRRGAILFFVVLLVVGLGVANSVPGLLLLLIGYVALNCIYSQFLKHVPVVDIATVASFYVMRIIAGGIAATVPLSPWIILATFFLALFLVSGKRLGEFTRGGKRRVLTGYTRQTLEGIVLGAAILAIASYGLWSVLVHPSAFAVYTVIPVTAVLFRTHNRLYQEPERAEAPEVLVFTDAWTFALVTLWAAGMFSLFYAA